MGSKWLVLFLATPSKNHELSQRENVAKLFRAGRAQAKAASLAKLAEAPMRVGALRARLPTETAASDRAEWKSQCVVPSDIERLADSLTRIRHHLTFEIYCRL